MPNDDIVLVAILLPAQEVWTGNLSFDQRVADLVFSANP